MKSIFTSLLAKRIQWLTAIYLVFLASVSIAQVTATEDFENESTNGSFSESGINFNHTFTLQNFPGAYPSGSFGYNGSAKYIDLARSSGNTATATISINNTLNPGYSFKINSFAAFIAGGNSGTPAINGTIVVSGIAVGGVSSVSAVITVNSLSAGGNGVVSGLNFTGTALDGLYFTSLTFTIIDNDISNGNVGTSYLELDHINFTASLPVTNQFSISDASVLEGSSGTKNMAFTISCTSTTVASSVQVQSVNGSGSATAGTDYVAYPLTTVSFAIGDPTSKTVNVTINGDLTIEPDETFSMTLINPTGGTIVDGLGTGTILDDDNISETFEDETVGSATTTFSERGFSFSSNGSLLVSRGVNIGAGNCNCNSNALDTRVGNGGSTGNVGSFYINSAGTSFNLNSIDVFTSNNDGTTGTTSNVNVTFTGAKADGTGTVTYTATVTPISGNTFQTVSFTGTPLANIQLLSVAITLGSGANYIALDNIKYGTVTFSGTQLSINDVSVLEGTGGGTTTAVFTVTRSNNSSAFSVNVASSDLSATAGSDYTAFSTTLNFTSGGPLSQTVGVTIIRDASIEANETFNMTLSGATNGVLYQKSVGLGTILDDDKIVETFEDETTNATTFSENSITFSASGGRFRVNYNSGSTDGSGSSKGYLTTSNSAGTSTNVGGTLGKISITSANKGFKLLQLDAWTGNGTTPSFVTGPVTFSATLYGGGTVSTTKTITPTNNTGTGWQQNITFTGTPLENAVLTDLTFIAGGSVTALDLDNINYVVVTTAPFIEVVDASNAAITNGGAASSTNNTDFGTICTGGSLSKTYTIKNTGGVDLVLSGSPLAVLSGTNASQFTITTPPSATVVANSSTTFTVAYNPTAAGTHNAIITLTSNDGNNSPYVINIKGAAATVSAGSSFPTMNVGTTASLTATGATSYAWTAPSTAPLTSANNTSSAQASLNTTGVQTFTLVGTTGGCSSTKFVSITVVEGPDLTATINLPQNGFAAGSSKNVLMSIQEVGGAPTASNSVIVTITVPSGYTVIFPGSLTSMAADGGSTVAVANTNWTVSNTVTNQQISVKLNTGQSLGANSTTNLGFIVTRTSANTGSVSNITVNIANDSNRTYDVNSVNNIYARIISGL